MEAHEKEPKYRVLILHGWLHSSECYKKLAQDLGDLALVDLYEFPGFGHKVYQGRGLNILSQYRAYVKDLLIHGDYDLVISHSMGGNVLLRALEDLDHPPKKLLLSNTAYRGIPLLKPLAWALPLFYLGLRAIQVLPEKVGKPILKALALFTIQEPRSFKDSLYTDMIQANALVASLTLFQLTYDSFSFDYKKLKRKPWILLTYSEKDKVIACKKTKALIEDLKPDEVKEFKGIGHTPVLEAYGEYVELIGQVLKKT